MSHYSPWNFGKENDRHVLKELDLKVFEKHFEGKTFIYNVFLFQALEDYFDFKKGMFLVLSRPVKVDGNDFISDYQLMIQTADLQAAEEVFNSQD